MEPKINYTVVGIVVLVLFAALIASLLWLSVGFDRKPYTKYLVYIDESVHGLSVDSPIKFNGVKIGKVSRVSLDFKNPQQIRLLLNIERSVPITISTYATLITQGITGSTFLGLTASTPTLIRLKVQKGQRYPVIPYKPSFYNRIENNVSELSDSLKRVFDAENAMFLKKILSNLQKFTHVVEENDKSINEILHSLPESVRQFTRAAHDVGKMASAMSASSRQFSSTMRAGKTSIDEITQQTIPSMNALIQRMDLIATNLTQVSELMKQNPAVIVRGIAPQSLGPGE